MKNIFFGLLCLTSFTVQALEFEQQFENEQISVSKVKIESHEEIGLHRDAYPQVVIALKGGTITRLEADGRKVDVQFPTGVAVTREADPKDALHKSVNNSSEAVDLIIIQLKTSPPPIEPEKEKSHDISVSIQIKCPSSDEFQAFLKSIPPDGNYSSSLKEWKSSFSNNMNQLLQLVESEKIFKSSWSVHTQEQ